MHREHFDTIVTEQNPADHMQREAMKLPMGIRVVEQGRFLSFQGNYWSSIHHVTNIVESD
jgi:hypothetical protein